MTATIRRDIITGRLAPDGNLRIRDMCERYDAGAIPVREALSRLVTGGFVVAEDQRGFRVAGISAEELRDITQTRVFLESEALRLAIERGDLDWEQRLIGVNYRLSRLPMLDSKGSLAADWEAAHSEFHAALLASCGSDYLQELARQLRDQTARYRHLSILNIPRAAGPGAGGAPAAHGRRGGHASAGARVRDVAVEHQQLCEAALARDVTRSCELLSAHYWTTANMALAHAIADDDAPGSWAETAVPA